MAPEVLRSSGHFGATTTYSFVSTSLFVFSRKVCFCCHLFRVLLAVGFSDASILESWTAALWPLSGEFSGQGRGYLLRLRVALRAHRTGGGGGSRVIRDSVVPESAPVVLATGPDQSRALCLPPRTVE